MSGGDAAAGSLAAATPRQRWLAVLARTPVAVIDAALAGYDTGDATWPRRGEMGMIMLEGRAGGTGQRFSLGQATVTRATCLLKGSTGVGYVMGHAPEQAEAMALADALLQGPDHDALEAALIGPQALAQAAEVEATSRKAAATQVRFFTMERTSSAGVD